MQAGVEPLRRIGRRHLARQHEAHLVEKGARVLFAVEIAALPAPIGPGAGEPVEHLPGRGLGDVALGLGQRLERGLVGDGAPQERGNVVLLDALQPRRARRPCGNISARARRPRPGSSRREPRSRQPEHHRAVGIADLALGHLERDRRVRGVRTLGVAPFDAHKFRFPHGFAGVRVRTAAAAKIRMAPGRLADEIPPTPRPLRLTARQVQTRSRDDAADELNSARATRTIEGYAFVTCSSLVDASAHTAICCG